MVEQMPGQGAAERREMSERFEFAYRSLPSERHPSYNEDRHLENAQLGLYGVFDGVGGHFGGKEASAAAAASVLKDVHRAWDKIDDDEADDTIRPSLANTLRAANKAVIGRGKEIYTEKYLKIPEAQRPVWHSPQTTATIAKLHEFADGRMKAYFAHVGDCRAYVRRADGTLEQLTVEDDILSDAGEVARLSEEFHMQLTDADIERYRQLMDEVASEAEMPDALGRYLFRTRNIVARTLGHDYGTGTMGVRTYAADVSPGDTILMMSDGVHDNLTRQRIQDIAAQTSNPDALVERLSIEAYEYGHAAPAVGRDDPVPRNKRDDITAMAIRIKPRT